MTFVSSEGKQVRTISADGVISDRENKIYNNEFCLATVSHRDDQRGCSETFREDFVKRLDFDDGDYLIIFPDSTRIRFSRAERTYLGEPDQSSTTTTCPSAWPSTSTASATCRCSAGAPSTPTSARARSRTVRATGTPCPCCWTRTRVTAGLTQGLVLFKELRKGARAARCRATNVLCYEDSSTRSVIKAEANGEIVVRAGDRAKFENLFLPRKLKAGVLVVDLPRQVGPNSACVGARQLGQPLLPRARQQRPQPDLGVHALQGRLGATARLPRLRRRVRRG